MKDLQSEAGVVIILTALFSGVLLVFIAIAFDLWNFEADTVRIQLACDAGTLASGLVLSTNLEDDEVTAIATQLANEQHMFNTRLTADPAENPYADPEMNLTILLEMLYGNMRSMLTGEGIPAGSLDSCMSRIEGEDLGGDLSQLTLNIKNAIDHDSCISDTIKGQLKIELIKKVAETVARDNLVVSTFRDDEIKDVSLTIKDNLGNETTDPMEIQKLSMNVQADSEVYLANHVFGLSAEDSIERRKVATGEKNYVAIILLLDISGSMTPTAMANLKTAAKNFAAEFQGSENALGLVSYSSSATTIRELEANFNQSEYEATIDTLTAGGCTNIDDAFKHAQQEYAKSVAQEKLKVVILITDGKPNRVAGQTWPFCSAGNSAYRNPICRSDDLREDGSIVYSIGFGTNINDNFLKRTAYDSDSPGTDDSGTCSGWAIEGDAVKSYEYLGTLGVPSGNYYRAPDSTGLNSLLSAVAGKIKFRLTE